MMDWEAEGIALRIRPHGESAAILTALTADRGVHAGVVRGGAGRRLAPVLQPGAHLHLHWRARLNDHLGAYTVEPLRAHAAALMADPDRLAALSAVCALAAFALPEREPQPRLFAATLGLLARLAAGGPWFGAYLAWERLLLEETGYGLDLTRCALSGATEGLTLISPRTGRAVTAAAAGAYAARLLPLPRLLADPDAMPADAAPDDARAEMAQGLATTGHFLARVLAPALGDRPLPNARAHLAARFSPSRGPGGRAT
ncbi:DNA repair protein RecO [Pararhodobacter sp. SW119]|uniref:DNA repair protein RecO n=1 Tax=Pararhodobacter sp. SW119 TaxID=2780075 RepID=UPI001ADEE3A2